MANKRDPLFEAHEKTLKNSAVHGCQFCKHFDADSVEMGYCKYYCDIVNVRMTCGSFSKDKCFRPGKLRL